MKYTDFNEIVQEYKIKKEGGYKELTQLKKALSDVPVSLVKFRVYLGDMHNANFNELVTRAEFVNPSSRIVTLDDLTDFVDADEIMSKMILPYPLIKINGESISNNFYRRTKRDIGSLFPNPKFNKIPARILHQPDYPAVVIIYPDKRKKDRLNYLEIELTRDKF